LSSIQARVPAIVASIRNPLLREWLQAAPRQGSWVSYQVS
jgi:hypothetical protein